MSSVEKTQYNPWCSPIFCTWSTVRTCGSQKDRQQNGCVPFRFALFCDHQYGTVFSIAFFVSSQSFCMLWCNGNDETSTYMNANTEQTLHTCPFCFCCGVSSSSIYVCKGFAFVKVRQNNSFLSFQNSNVAYSPPGSPQCLLIAQSPLTCPDSPVPEGVHPQSLMLSPTPKTLTKDMDPFTVDKNIAHPTSTNDNIISQCFLGHYGSTVWSKSCTIREGYMLPFAPLFTCLKQLPTLRTLRVSFSGRTGPSTNTAGPTHRSSQGRTQHDPVEIEDFSALKVSWW